MLYIRLGERMLTLGVSAGFHDAGLAVVEDGEICFAGHSERYSKKKHDKDLCEPIRTKKIIKQLNCHLFFEVIKKFRI